jgi:hypothetical protein
MDPMKENYLQPRIIPTSKLLMKCQDRIRHVLTCAEIYLPCLLSPNGAGGTTPKRKRKPGKENTTSRKEWPQNDGLSFVSSWLSYSGQLFSLSTNLDVALKVNFRCDYCLNGRL